jgi:hypothetical protein
MKYMAGNTAAAESIFPECEEYAIPDCIRGVLRIPFVRSLYSELGICSYSQLESMWLFPIPGICKLTGGGESTNVYSSPVLSSD